MRISYRRRLRNGRGATSAKLVLLSSHRSTFPSPRLLFRSSSIGGLSNSGMCHLFSCVSILFKFFSFLSFLIVYLNEYLLLTFHSGLEFDGRCRTTMEEGRRECEITASL